MKHKQILCRLLGLNAETATDEEITAAAEKAGVNVGNVQALAANIEAAIQPLNAKIETLEKDLLQSRKDAVIASATAQGKVVGLSAEVISKITLEDLQKHVDGLKSTVPLNSQTPGKVDDDGKDVVITEQMRTIALNCGLDPDVVYGKKKTEEKK